MDDLAIISLHDRGFWQGDLYVGAVEFYEAGELEQMGLSPDAFFTLAKGSTEDDARREAEKHWPGARIVVADDEEDKFDD